MTMGTNVITREELYELVWSTSMTKVRFPASRWLRSMKRVSIGYAHIPRV